MAFRKTRRSKEALERMRNSRDSNRQALPAPDYPPELPDLRRRIIIQDFDFGERIHTLDLYRTNRVDCYRVVADGVPWKSRMGWSRILAGLRKSMPRVSSAV